MGLSLVVFRTEQSYLLLTKWLLAVLIWQNSSPLGSLTVPQKHFERLNSGNGFKRFEGRTASGTRSRNHHKLKTAKAYAFGTAHPLFA